MLSPYRVLDLTNERGLLAGQILADLGADVIQVEPPTGSTARAVPPFFDAEQDPAEASIYWACYARNKRGITCDLTQPEGRDLLFRLIKSADFLFESGKPGEMASLGLSYDDVQSLNPAIIYTSLSPFGQDGPKAGYEDTELILWASGGPLLPTGDADRPPIRISVPQAYHHASGDAADGALVAHFERVRSDQGQHVDISVQQSVAQATISQVLAHQVGAPEPFRNAKGIEFGGTFIKTKWKAVDGWVELTLGMGTATGHFTNNLIRWMVDQGAAGPELLDIDWHEVPALLASGQLSTEKFQGVHTLIEDFIALKTKAELLEAAVERKLLLVPHSTVPSLIESTQLQSRDYWRESEYHGKAVRFPGPFVKASNRPIQYRRPAPALGQHNHEVYVGELGLSEAEFQNLEARGVI